ncbi:carbohydrate kinase family protein [Thioalkalivibrio denitrificans]|uniref:carbohydrate kinase family protein n=1 Tax=Thioalkalivibrio denitrificans TaxID=108003 RepID=UPI003CCBB094
MTASSAGPVIFGEVLFDCFPDRRVLGGAPFNVAWNLHGLGGNPLFVGAVGDDRPGADVRRIMAAWGMDDSGLQTDPAHPTGTVQVSLEGGEPSYEIVADQAYDHVDRQAALTAIAGREDAILYHGSLALRDTGSRETLAALRDTVRGGVFMDVNLRAPWWDRDTVRELVANSAWVKLNQDELDALGDGDMRSPQDGARALLSRYGLRAVILTRGSEGALVAASDGLVISQPAPPVDGLVDTVGAGDAFSAVVLLGIMEGWGWETILERAARFAAQVCTLRGATTEDRSFYAEQSRAW